MPSASHAAQPSVLNWIYDVYSLPESQRPMSPPPSEDSRADSPVLGDKDKKPVYVDILVDLEPKPTPKMGAPAVKKVASHPSASSTSGPRESAYARRDRHPRAMPLLPPMHAVPPVPRSVNPRQYPLHSTDDDPTLFYNNIPSRLPSTQQPVHPNAVRDSTKRRGFVSVEEIQDHYQRSFPPPPPPPPPSVLTTRLVRAPTSRYSEESQEEFFPLPPPLRRPILSHRSNSTTSSLTSARTPSLMTPSSEYSSFSESESDFDSHGPYLPQPPVRNRVRLGVRTYDYDAPAFEFAHIVEGAGEWRWHPYDDERAYAPAPRGPQWEKPQWDDNLTYDDRDGRKPHAPAYSRRHERDMEPDHCTTHTRRRATSQRSNDTLSDRRSNDGHRSRPRLPQVVLPEVPPPVPPKAQTKRNKFMNFVFSRLAWRPAAVPKKAVSLPPPSIRNRFQVSLDPDVSVASLAPPVPALPSQYCHPNPSLDGHQEYHHHHHTLRPVASNGSSATSTKVKPNLASLKTFFFS